MLEECGGSLMSVIVYVWLGWVTVEATGRRRERNLDWLDCWDV